MSEMRRPPSDPSSSNRKQSTQQGDALEYLKAVKTAFHENSAAYQNFLQIMKEFKNQTYSTEEVVRRVKELFRFHPKLILGFNQFLPSNFHITLTPKNPVNFDLAMRYVSKVKDNVDPHVYRTFLSILYSYKKVERQTHDVIHEVQQLLQNHPYLLEEFYQFAPIAANGNAGPIPEPASTPPLQAENEPNGEENEAGSSDRSAKTGSQSSPEDQNMSGSVQDIIDVKGEPVAKFLEKAKGRLETEAYEDILKCVFSYSEGAMIADDVNMLVPDILANHPDLLAEFNELILYREKFVKKGDEEEDGDEEEGEDEDEDDEEEEKEREMLRERRSIRSKTPPLLSKEKFNMCKPVSELDFSNCKQCTPSYRLLPKNHVMPPSTNRSELEREVLNDKWVSVTSGSEDYSFNHMRRNQYEESLFRCEDDRHELDMLVETAKSTVERLERLLKKLNRGKLPTDELNHIDDYFTPMNIRCIEKLYGDHGLDVMDVIKKNIEASLPVILMRLYQKIEEWTDCRTDFNRVWADVYAKNYPKSLDHRSFIFKQEDMKNLSSKALQTEIQEMHDRNLNDDALLIAIGAKRKSGSLPDMVFELPDLEIQEDVYQLIKFSCKEVFPSAEQSSKAMKVYTSFLEPFLGVVNRAHLLECSEDEKNAKNLDKKARIFSMGGTGATIAVDESSGTGSPGGADVAGVSASPSKKTGSTIDAAKKEFSKQGEEREEGEISPEREEIDVMMVDNNSPSSGDPPEVGENEENEEQGGGGGGGEEEEEEGEIDHQDKMESEGEAPEEITDSPLFDNGTAGTAKPLAKRFVAGTDSTLQVFYADGPFYALFRLYQVLYERMLCAKKNSKDAERKWVASRGANPGDLYGRFKKAVYGFLDGSIDSAKYEDECMLSIGTHQSYSLYTLDKLIFKFCKQLQVIETEETSKKLLELYFYEKSRGPGQFNEKTYYDNALVLLHEETIYRLSSDLKEGKLRIQLTDQLHKSPEFTAVSINPDFGEYLFNDYMCTATEEKKEIQAVYLKRNKRKQMCDDETSADCNALDGTIVSNALECKMSHMRSKVQYVLDTEDYFYRQSKRRRKDEDEIAKWRASKSEKFAQFLSRLRKLELTKDK